MATDKLINQTQGDDIIDALSDIATNVSNITYGPQTSADKVVSMIGYAEAAEAASINPGDTLNQAIGKLEKKADDNATAVADKIDKLTSATAGDIATVTATGEIADSAVAIETTLSDSSDAEVPTSKAVGTYVAGKGYAVGVNSSTANNLVAFNDANGKALKDSGIAVATSTTGLADSDTAVPTSKTVKTYVDSTATGISRYLGTITAASQLSTSAKKGDFYVVKTAWSGVHAGDEIIAEKDNPSQTIDGTNWSLLHNEADTDTKYTFATGEDNGTFKVTPSDTGTAQSVPIKGLGNAAYKGVADTVSTSTDLVTSNAVNTKLASYVPNSDFVVAKQNILLVDEMNGARNEFVFNPSFIFPSGLSYSLSDKDGLSLSGTTTSSFTAWIYTAASAPNGKLTNLTEDYVLITYGDISYTGSLTTVFCQWVNSAGTMIWSDLYYSSVLTLPAGVKQIDGVYIQHQASTTTNISFSNLKFLLCPKRFYDAGFTTYQPYASPNYRLTPAVIEQVDAGAKNLLKCFDSYSVGGITMAASNGVVSATWTAIGSSNAYCRINEDLKLAPGQYICTGMQASNVSYYLHLELDGSTVNNAETTEGFEFTVTNASATYRLFLGVKANTAAQSSPITVKPMICTKAAFGVSSKFVPYRPNWDLVCRYAYNGGFNPSIISNADLNAINQTAFAVYNNPSNMPSGQSGFCFVRTTVFDINGAIQELFMLTGIAYFRAKTDGNWSAWKQTTNA